MHQTNIETTESKLNTIQMQSEGDRQRLLDWQIADLVLHCGFYPFTFQIVLLTSSSLRPFYLEPYTRLPED
jgi:hypothetical protein